jgi:uncharacterized delta-60 repeat protein
MKRTKTIVIGGILAASIALITLFVGSQIVVTQTAGGLIAGRNVNMVSGTRLPWGDPWLQRQNEPSLAVSSRNTMHLLAGANDYRTIDMPDNYRVPGIPPQAAARDAWLGLFKSFDGGQSWITTLLPGFPQDTSPEGLSSPIHGFEAACDPSVRAGSNGLFYYSGIAFNRSGGSGAVFLARFIDNNNLEKVKKSFRNDWQWVVEDDPIKYVNTKIIDTGNPGQFIDMPSVAADIPRNSLAGTSNIMGQAIPNANVYMAYSVFLGNIDVVNRSKLMFIRSTNCGESWGAPIKLSESQQIIQRPVIAIDPHDPTGNTVYVAFRRFALAALPGTLAICKSSDGGKSFTKAIAVETLLYPFDQAMDGSKFRTNCYPAVTVDANGIVYMAWAQRMGSTTAQSRIVLKTSPDGVDWSRPAQYVETTSEEDGTALEGNQFMPSLTFAAGRLLLAWYDQRETLSPDKTSGAVADSYPNRQTIDVRAAEGLPGLLPVFGRSDQVSRYLHYLALDEDGEPIEQDGYFLAYQAEYNPPNFPLFQLGTRPFHGDYIDLAAAPLILPPPVAGGAWAYNTEFGHPVTFHSAWADNRDVRPPADNWWGDWTNYTPPNSEQDSIFAQQNICGIPSDGGMRNQNVYTAEIDKGLFVGSPGNTKQLDIPAGDGGRRTFVVLVRNSTELSRTLDFQIQELGGINASFTQSGDTNALADVLVAPYSSHSCTVYVDDSPILAPVKVNVLEGGAVVGYALLNPDATNMLVSDPDASSTYLTDEKHNPRVMNPRVWNYDLGSADEPNPRVMNPRVMNPRVMNPRVMNPRVMNPRVMNPRVMNPRVMNDSIVSHEVANPRVMNPRVMNTALTDVTWVVSNEGNTTSSYTFDIVSTVDQYFVGDPPPLIGQVLVYKLHMVPGGYACGLYDIHEDELLVNVTNPRVMNPGAINNVPDDGTATTQMTSATTDDGLPQDVTFYLAPGEEAFVTFRVWDDDTTDSYDFDAQTVTAYVEAEAINTGETLPTYALPDDGPPWVAPLPQIGVGAAALSFYALPETTPDAQPLAIWNAGGDLLEYTVSVDAAWLSVTPSSGSSESSYDEQPHTVSVNTAGLPLGTYPGTITINDPDAANNPLRLPVILTITTVLPSAASEWVARYNGPANGLDTLRAIAVDVAGNVYVAAAENVGTENWDYLTIKYDPSGNPVWMARYAGPGNGRDFPNAIALDPAGNVFVTGQSYGADGTSDYATVKYDNSGNLLWVARYAGAEGSEDEAYDVTVDDSGNAYVTGYYGGGGGTDIATVKHAAADGSVVWAAVYDGPANGPDCGFELALDALGNVHVSGYVQNVSTGADAIVLKYDSTGAQQWEAVYNGPGNGYDGASELAVDAAGNVYAAGTSMGDGTGHDYVAIKYNSMGVLQWASRYTGAGAGRDVVQELILAPGGGVYVTGSTQRSEVPTENDIMTIRYNAEGVETWRARYGGVGDNGAFEMAVDMTGGLYVVGEGTGGSGSGEIVTIKYQAGREDWVRRYTGPGAGNSLGHEVVLDATGNVYVGGYSYGIGTLTDITTIKYRPGLEEWRAEYNGSANGDDEPQAVVTDAEGNIYVTGSSVNGAGDKDYLTVKYDPEGTYLWEARYDGPGGGDDVPAAIAVDASGNVFVTGSSQGASTGIDFATVMYDSDGNPVWAGVAARYVRDGESTGEDSAHAIAVDGSGVYVTGRSFNGTDFDWVTLKYDLAGAVEWTSVYDNGGGDWPFAMAVDDTGDVYVAGESVIVEDGFPTVDTEMTTIKYAGTDGTQLAIDRYHDYLFDGFTDIFQATDIAVRSDSEGVPVVAVTGVATGMESGDNFVTILYNPDLARLWKQNYNGPGGGDDVPFGVEIDAAGNVYVTGDSYGGETTNRDFATIKYDALGNQEWIRRYNGTASLDDAPAAMALDSSGNVYVTGWSIGSYERAEYVTVKYDPAGVARWVTEFRGGLLGVDMAKAVAVDAEGNVIVTGRTQFYATGPIIHWNFATFKYRKEEF